MKKILALAILGITALITYCEITSKRKLQTHGHRHDISRKKNHHTTDIFTRAKRYASEKE